MTTHPVFRLFTLVLLAIGLTASSQGKDRPFKGSAAGLVQEAEMFAEPVVGGGPFMRETGLAEGNFTHKGKCEVLLEWLVSVELVEEELIYVLEGEFTSISANGDRMVGTFRAEQKATGAAYKIEVTVTGGTGRFAKARGIIPGKGWRMGDEFSYALTGLLDY